MKRSLLFLSFVSILLFITACSPTNSTALPQTGDYAVSPIFQAYYESKGGLKTLGIPISNQEVDNGIPVQYFSNMRLEYFADLPEGQRVRLSKLLNSTYSQPCLKPENVTPNAYFFNECHSVIPEFQPYFNQFGGLEFFGNPISEMQIKDGVFIQYFEHGAITWDSKKPTNNKLGFGALGRVAKYEKPNGTQSTTITTATLSTLKTKVTYPILAKGQQQIITATLLDTMGKPVAGVKVSYVVTLSGYGTITSVAPATNAQGVSILTLSVVELKSQNIISYLATATENNNSVMDQGEFMPWIGKP